MVESLVKAEGGATDEPSYDGRKLRWTEESRRALRRIDEAYLRRRTKARIEKSARLRKLGTVTLEFAQRLIEEETGLPFGGTPENSASDSEPKTDPETDGKRLIARDDKNNPLFSAFDWTEDAAARILRVPLGFMRDRTQARIEELARERGVQQIDLEQVEAGVELGLKMMVEMVSEQNAGSDPERREAPVVAPECPAARERAFESKTSHHEEPLNVVSQMSELAAVRMLLTEKRDAGEE